jgi:DNA-binding beta-propeller fold protein YncE
MREKSGPSGAELSRRKFLAATGATVAGLAVGGRVAAEEIAPKTPVTIGSGKWAYTLVDGWGAPPDGMKYDFGCAIVVDARDRVYVHSHAQKMVLVFDRDGKLLSDFNADFAGSGSGSGNPSGHGLYHQKAGRDEFLYFSVLEPYHEVVKTDLNGKVLMRLGQVKEESSTSIKFPFNMPTDVAVAPNGDLYVAEGYGGNKVHRFDEHGKFIQTIGEPGKGPGQFTTPHGIWIDTRKAKHEPEVYVADRNNNRLQVFTLDGKLKREVKEGIRQPCCFYPYKNVMFVPDLDKVVTILDENDAVVAQLGDGRTVTDDSAFKAPHALTVDSHGDLYVVEWVPDARLRKFKHTPQKA